jgi:hypothetical protein
MNDRPEIATPLKVHLPKCYCFGKRRGVLAPGTEISSRCTLYVPYEIKKG